MKICFLCFLYSTTTLPDKTNPTRVLLSRTWSFLRQFHGSECTHITHLSLISVSTTLEACAVRKAYRTGCGDAATRQRWTLSIKHPRGLPTSAHSTVQSITQCSDSTLLSDSPQA
ncbi:hypothetical protein EDB87DRAFT_5617 [Lactarius vividus]|nr:hypothetical protein EDB87DRAFT_5617 [Lactarius vividus]